MSPRKKPALSIGIIFKNEIRCIERCLKSLAPLREAVPCEVVMADTGSTDGSREIAEKYADILFDFPWINDFAAARNAVMDRSSGRWFMSIDCDEWLEGDLKQLITFTTKTQEVDVGTIVVRNYNSDNLDNGGYSDFIAIRLIRLSTGLRYEGAVHEAWPLPRNVCLGKIEGARLDHDGYLAKVFQGQNKRERNMTLLRELLAKDPESTHLLKLCIDSSVDDPEYLSFIRRGIQAVEQKKGTWEFDGPAILCAAVKGAYAKHLSKLDEWADKAEELFPDSVIVKVDIPYFVCINSYSEHRYARAIEAGEKYLAALAEYNRGALDPTSLLFSVVNHATSIDEQRVRVAIADACCREGQMERCFEVLMDADGAEMDFHAAWSLAEVLTRLHTKSNIDTAPLVTKLWEALNTPKPSEERAEERRKAFLQNARAILDKWEEDSPLRAPWGTFAPLSVDCDLGRATAIMGTDNPAELERLLSAVEKWDELPPTPLAHALDRGVRFPLPGRPLKLEEMDGLAAGLTAEPEVLRQLVAAVEPAGADGQKLGWMRAVTLALVQGCTWDNEEEDLALARKFAEVEREFLPRCYAPGMLTEENLFLLPGLHRFGFYCVRAFDAMDSGDLVGCVRQLRAGLESSHERKKMVQFLLARVEDMERAPKIAAAPPELVALANQVKAMLAKFEPDDPAVVELKNSPVYQKVAWLIEAPAQPTFGDIMQ